MRRSEISKSVLTRMYAHDRLTYRRHNCTCEEGMEDDDTHKKNDTDSKKGIRVWFSTSSCPETYKTNTVSKSCRE